MERNITGCPIPPNLGPPKAKFTTTRLSSSDSFGLASVVAIARPKREPDENEEIGNPTKVGNRTSDEIPHSVPQSQWILWWPHYWLPQQKLLIFSKGSLPAAPCIVRMAHWSHGWSNTAEPAGFSIMKWWPKQCRRTIMRLTLRHGLWLLLKIEYQDGTWWSNIVFKAFLSS